MDGGGELMADTRTELFDNWLKRAQPGEHYIYYTGELARDRTKFVQDATNPNVFTQVDVEPLHSFAAHVLATAVAGLVVLSQTPSEGEPNMVTGVRQFDYIATRTDRLL